MSSSHNLKIISVGSRHVMLLKYYKLNLRQPITTHKLTLESITEEHHLCKNQTILLIWCSDGTAQYTKNVNDTNNRFTH